MYIWQSIILVLVSIFIFYALGISIQKRFKIAPEFFSLSIPIGFIIFIFINQIFYTPLIFFEVTTLNLTIFEIIKDIFILILIIWNYKYWINIGWLNKITFKKLGCYLSIFSVIFVVVQFSTFIIGIDVENESINAIVNNWSYDLLSDINSSIQPLVINGDNLYSNISYYYWILVISNITSIDTQILYEWYSSIIMYLSFFGVSIFITNKYFKSNTYTIATFIVLFISFFVGSNANTGNLFLLLIFALLWAMNVNFITADDANNNSLILSSLIVFTSSAFVTNSTIIILMWLFSMIFIIILKGGGFTKFSLTTLSLATLNFFSQLYWVIGDLFFWGISVAIIISIIIISYFYYTRKKKTIRKIENSFITNKRFIISTFAVLTISIGSIMIALEPQNYYQEAFLPTYLSGINNGIIYNFELFKSVLIDILLVITVIIGYLYFSSNISLNINRSIAYTSFVIFIIFLNPLSLGLFYAVTGQSLKYIKDIYLLFFMLLLFISIFKYDFSNLKISIDRSFKKLWILDSSFFTYFFTLILGIIYTVSLIFSNSIYTINYVTKNINNPYQVTEYINNSFSDNTYITGDVTNVVTSNLNIKVNLNKYYNYLYVSNDQLFVENFNMYQDDDLINSFNDYLNYYSISEIYIVKNNDFSKPEIKGVSICDISNNNFTTYYYNINNSKPICLI